MQPSKVRMGLLIFAPTLNIYIYTIDMRIIKRETWYDDKGKWFMLTLFGKLIIGFRVEE